MIYLFGLGMLAMFLVYPLYFFELTAFGKEAQKSNPEYWTSLRRRFPLSQPLHIAYQLLRDDKLFSMGEFSSEVGVIRDRANRLLSAGVTAFMVTLAGGLGSSI